jgi:hypothetical protein
MLVKRKQKEGWEEKGWGDEVIRTRSACVVGKIGSSVSKFSKIIPMIAS